MRTGSQAIAISTYLRTTMSSFSSSPSTSAKGSTSNSRSRWLSLAKPALGVALAMGVLTAGQARAVIVNVDGQDWDVTTFSGSYAVMPSKFNLPSNGGVMPWWGQQALAQSFARAVGSALGFPNITPDPSHRRTSPYFTSWNDYYGACQEPPAGSGPEYCATHGSVMSNWSTDGTSGVGVLAFATYDGPYIFAQANLITNAAPGPLPALGVAAAFGYSRKLRKRIKCSTNTSTSL